MEGDLTSDEMLVLLIEECGEVIQAATKCLRFGIDREWPGYGNNRTVLSRECGDLEGVVAAMQLDQGARRNAFSTKMARARKAKATIGREAEKQVSGFSEPRERYVEMVRELNDSKG